jgi:hypothetical protein
MIADLEDKVNSDEALVRRGRYLTTTFLLEHGATAWLISIVNGRVTSIARGPFVMPTWSFVLRSSDDEWNRFWSSDPAPGFHDLMALVKRKTLKIEGDVPVFMANLRYFKEALVKLRATEGRL